MKNYWWCLVAAPFLLLPVRHAGGLGTAQEFVLVCDAGSSGTRFYLFSRGAEGGPRLPSSALLKLETPLSEQTPETAFDYVRPGLVAALDGVPDGSTLDWYLYGTAGMRALEDSSQRDLYASLREGAAAWDAGSLSKSKGLRAGAYPAKRLAPREMKTLRGDEEGYFAALAVNYLGGKLAEDLRPVGADGGGAADGLYGALDLGGSSTQVAYAPGGTPGGGSASPLSEENFFVRSYNGYGANAVRGRLLEAFAERRPGKPHPCLFRGEAIEVDGRSWEGGGDGGGCMSFIAGFLDDRGRDCARTDRNDTWCDLDGVLRSKPPPGTEYYAFSVYHYAVLFARDVTSHYASETAGVTPLPLPSPTLGELKAAVETVCAMAAGRVHLETPISPMTPEEQVYRRCFDLSYIYTVLDRLGADTVHFTEKIDGHKVSWTIGAYLLVLAREASQKRRSSGPERGWEAPSHSLGYMCVFALSVLGAIAIRGRHRIRLWFLSLRVPRVRGIGTERIQMIETDQN